MEWVDLRQAESGVDVTLVHHGKDEEKLRVKYLVGAVGAKGPVRKLVSMSLVGETRKPRAVIGDVELSGLDDRFVNLSELLVKAAVDIECLHECLRDITRNPDIKITKIRSSAEWRLNERVAGKFSVGGVFIGGDAGHVYSPTGGQGLNTGTLGMMNPPGSSQRAPVVHAMLNVTHALADKLFKSNDNERGAAQSRYASSACAIAGVDAGPVELVGAFASAQSGFFIRVIDKGIRFPVSLRGCGIQPRTEEVYHLLGCLSDDLETAGTYYAQKAHDSGGKIIEILTDEDLLVQRDPLPEIPFVSLQLTTKLIQHDTNCAILRDHFKKYGVEVELSNVLIDLKHDESGADVALNYSGKERKLCIKYLVGAVGAKGGSFDRMSLLNMAKRADQIQ
ncbi:unnamed protein product [Peniophora sp. CBMAI 1063]|nr:unnamed protein product [Peniophora sp. CBMAI 1063]